MLRGLSIRDLLLIDRLDLEFRPGLNVLTGETGAGKSILLDSLGFVLGWRGRADLVRKGATQGEVIAEFDCDPGHPVRKILEEAAFPIDDTLVLRRINNRDGRKQAFVNDRRCSGEILRRISDTLVELHGQHDDRGLLNARGHRALLDAFSGTTGPLDACRQSWRELAAIRKQLQAAKAINEAAEKDREFLVHSVEELDSLSPQAGEDQALDTKRRLMQAAGRVREDIAKASEAMGIAGAEGVLADATRWLQGAAGQVEDRLDAPLEALERTQEELATAQRGAEDCLAALDFDPHDLEATEERLFAIRAVARKHGVAPDDLAGFAEELRVRLEALESGEKDIAALEISLKKAEKSFDDAASSLSKTRHKAARNLDAAMARELPPLKLERAVFTTELSDCDAGPDGRDTVQFTIATNPGAPSGPLDRIASGGELSRFLLALKVCLSAEYEDKTMIFDEIDRGVGGATADAVGRRLAALAADGQVLVVTHSPQVAAFGAHQWKVEKTVQSGETRSSVNLISGRERTEEIARMLAGDTVTDEARAAANVLLKTD